MNKPILKGALMPDVDGTTGPSNGASDPRRGRNILVEMRQVHHLPEHSQQSGGGFGGGSGGGQSFGGGGRMDPWQTSVETRLGSLDSRVGRIEDKLGTISENLATLTERVAHLPGKGALWASVGAVVVALAGFTTFAEKLQGLLP